MREGLVGLARHRREDVRRHQREPLVHLGPRAGRWRQSPGSGGGVRRRARRQSTAHLGDEDQRRAEQERQERRDEHGSRQRRARARPLDGAGRGVRPGGDLPPATRRALGVSGAEACARARRGGWAARPRRDRAGRARSGARDRCRLAGTARGSAATQQTQRASLEPALARGAHVQDARRGVRTAGRTIQPGPQRQEAACPGLKGVKAAAQPRHEAAQPAALPDDGDAPVAGAIGPRSA